MNERTWKEQDLSYRRLRNGREWRRRICLLYTAPWPSEPPCQAMRPHSPGRGREEGVKKKKSNKNFNLGETPLLLPYQNKYVLAHGFCAFTGVVTPPGLPCMHVYSREYPSLDDISVRVSLLIVDFLSFQCLGRCLSNSIRLVYFNSKFSSFFPL